ncbi:GIY-YIG nuclease family protein [uncultured Brevundimonas sp.]|uniref:GIY-YIG nuclease family protein n=1 Tax=uncultured Brevundimonas sp. TaxID=213418 RepID=UPI00262C9600|nr:GIY-YIG nuclease family protein [uncultured Brevundimonas sp.]
MTTPKNVKLFLATGNVDGIVTADIGQWSGRAASFPRTQVAEIAGHTVAQGAGVYVLSGPDEQHDQRDAIYIGEADHVGKRVLQHNSEDFWDRVCVLTASDGNLTKAHARYLESRFLTIAKDARRARVLNEKHPGLPALPTAEREDMEQFVVNALLLLPLLGFGFGRPLSMAALSNTAESTSPTFYLTAVGVEAKARQCDGGFVVLAGSTARAKGRPAWVTGRALREELREASVLVDVGDGERLRFAQDVPFTSPTMAASIVVASNQNGRVAWKLASGQTYGDWHEEQVADVSTRS